MNRKHDRAPSRLDEFNRRDIEIINRNADRLNGEALDVLGYQHLPLDDGPSPEDED